jgi:hypothetical protein
MSLMMVIHAQRSHQPLAPWPLIAFVLFVCVVAGITGGAHYVSAGFIVGFIVPDASTET